MTDQRAPDTVPKVTVPDEALPKANVPSVPEAPSVGVADHAGALLVTPVIICPLIPAAIETGVAPEPPP